MASRHYDILQIQPNATADEIQHAYRTLAMRYHPDRNSSPDAATKMAAINEAYETLRGVARAQCRPESREFSGAGNALNLDLAVSILSAARAVIIRNGWTAVQEDDTITVFAFGKSGAKIGLVDRLNPDSLLRIKRRFAGIVVILAVRIEGPVSPGANSTIVDLMHAERYGSALPDGPCKALLAAFL